MEKLIGFIHALGGALHGLCVAEYLFRGKLPTHLNVCMGPSYKLENFIKVLKVHYGDDMTVERDSVNSYIIRTGLNTITLVLDSDVLPTNDIMSLKYSGTGFGFISTVNSPLSPSPFEEIRRHFLTNSFEPILNNLTIPSYRKILISEIHILEEEGYTNVCHNHLPRMNELDGVTHCPTCLGDDPNKRFMVMICCGQAICVYCLEIEFRDRTICPVCRQAQNAQLWK